MAWYRRHKAKRPAPKIIPCGGYGRFVRTKCESTDDVVETNYDSMGEIFTANLCVVCRSYLLPASTQGGWAI